MLLSRDIGQYFPHNMLFWRFFFQGIAYIKFSKTSEAALAMEEMNGKCGGSDPRPLKVLIAHAKDQVKFLMEKWQFILDQWTKSVKHL